MSNPLEDQEEREAQQRSARRQARERDKRRRDDMQEALKSDSVRRLLWEFLTMARVDVSAYRTEPTATYHAVGWQDAGNWWINLIRQHCPEREAQMRAEARREAREGATDEDSNE